MAYIFLTPLSGLHGVTSREKDSRPKHDQSLEHYYFCVDSADQRIKLACTKLYRV